MTTYDVVLAIWDKDALASRDVTITISGDSPEKAARNATRNYARANNADAIEVKHVRSFALDNRIAYPVSGTPVRW